MLDVPEFKRGADVTLQVGRDDYSQALENGIRIIAEDIPSLSGENAPHKVTISNVPVYLLTEGVTEKAKRIGYSICTSDDCLRSVFSEDKFSRQIMPAFGRDERTGSENEFDHHSYFILKIAYEQIKKEHPALAIDDIFPKLPAGLENFIETAFRRVAVIKGNGNGEEKREMLWQSVALMQVYTMMAIGYLNMKEKGLATA